MLNKQLRLLYLNCTGNEDILISLMGSQVIPGAVEYITATYLPDPLVLKRYDGFVALGFGVVADDKILRQLLAKPPEIPGFYVYTVTKPDLPGIESVRLLCSKEEFRMVLQRVFGL